MKLNVHSIDTKRTHSSYIHQLLHRDNPSVTVVHHDSRECDRGASWQSREWQGSILTVKDVTGAMLLFTSASVTVAAVHNWAHRNVYGTWRFSGSFLFWEELSWFWNKAIGVFQNVVCLLLCFHVLGNLEQSSCVCSFHNLTWIQWHYYFLQRKNSEI